MRRPTDQHERGSPARALRATRSRPRTPAARRREGSSRSGATAGAPTRTRRRTRRGTGAQDGADAAGAPQARAPPPHQPRDTSRQQLRQAEANSSLDLASGWEGEANAEQRSIGDGQRARSSAGTGQAGGRPASGATTAGLACRAARWDSDARTRRGALRGYPRHSTKLSGRSDGVMPPATRARRGHEGRARGRADEASGRTNARHQTSPVQTALASASASCVAAS